MSSEMETNIVSVERVKEYSEAPTEVRKIKLMGNCSENNWVLSTGLIM